jgi:peptide/nickel transport system substrate-binding protein
MIRAEVSSGPFQLAEWVPGQYLAVKKSPGWGGARPAFDRIVFRFFKSEDGLMAALEAGEVDAAGEASGLSLDAIDILAQRLKASHEVVRKSSGGWLHLVVRLDHPLLQDVRARRAVSKAIDRRAVARLLYAGHGSPAFGMFPEGHPGHVAEGDLSFDPEGARRLLAEVPGEKKIELMYSSAPAIASAAALIADSLGKIGLEVQPIGLHFRVLSEKLRDRTQAPLALYALRANPRWDGRSLMHSGGGQNFSGLSDPEIDRVLDQAETSPDRATWGRHVLQVNLHFQRTLPAIPVLFKEVASVRPLWLEGWAPTGAQAPVTWNAEAWRRSP